MTTLPAPLVPAGTDLRDFAFMPLDVARLRDSDLAANETPECCWAAVLLWAASWHQVPAGSIPNDDRWIAKQAGYAQRGMIAAEWAGVRSGALHGWVLCSDGRLYHPVVAEKARDAWREKITHRWKRECDRVRKENKAREAKGLAPLELPPSPADIVTEGVASDRHEGGTDASEPSGPSKIGPGLSAEAHQKPVPMESTPFPAESFDFPAETGFPSGGIPLENALKGQGEGQGNDLSCPKPAAPVRTRKRYPENFERWWSAYPTDPLMSKSEAGKAWDRLTVDDRASAMAAIPGFVAHCRAKPDYRPLHAVRFLTQRRFEGYAAAATAPPGAHLTVVAEPRVDFGSGVSAPERLILDVIRRGEWLDGWGPKLGRPGCRLPQRIIDALAEEAA